jgi:hypothetical protein
MSLNRQLKMREQMRALILHYQRKLVFMQDADAERIARWLLDSMRSDLQQLEKEIA